MTKSKPKKMQVSHHLKKQVSGLFSAGQNIFSNGGLST